MSTQDWLALAVAAVALGFVVRRLAREVRQAGAARRGEALGCAGGCGCSAEKSMKALVRSRKARPRSTVGTK